MLSGLQLLVSELSIVDRNFLQKSTYTSENLLLPLPDALFSLFTYDCG